MVPVDKSSTVLITVMAFMTLGESFDLWIGIGMAIMFIGTMLIIEKKDIDETKAEKKT